MATSGQKAIAGEEPGAGGGLTFADSEMAGMGVGGGGGLEILWRQPQAGADV